MKNLFLKTLALSVSIASVTSYASQPNIVNSDVHESVPYIVSLITNVRGENMRTCAGTLISNEWVITSASCVHGFNTKKFLKVSIGEGDIKQPNPDQLLDVSEIVFF
ncbi:trypsin-like serine protease [Vibrio sp. S9_S30]|uniref:trypsin-like serine protease n=1 Tax=Vibrio sp. S9_S30 TaxID=2720226 RepID=UPI001680732B|nr:trypsin-like serine protease [Vibrio sp. S9_S30]MBD1556266.1 trypsin-like serine protease [Vibrio sp. S9_S30]